MNKLAVVALLAVPCSEELACLSFGTGLLILVVSVELLVVLLLTELVFSLSSSAIVLRLIPTKTALMGLDVVSVLLVYLLSPVLFLLSLLCHEDSYSGVRPF